MALPTDYLFEGESPLLPRPSWHPSAGFRAMLSGADEATKALVAEADDIGVRLVSVRPTGSNGVLALVSTMTPFEPPESLPFQLENDAGNTCAVQGKATWKKSEPSQGLAKRTKDFLGKQGLGDIYGGVAPLDFSACNIDQPSKLRLLLGKQSDNFVAFEE